MSTEIAWKSYKGYLFQWIWVCKVQKGAYLKHNCIDVNILKKYLVKSYSSSTLWSIAPDMQLIY